MSIVTVRLGYSVGTFFKPEHSIKSLSLSVPNVEIMLISGLRLLGWFSEPAILTLSKHY